MTRRLPALPLTVRLAVACTLLLAAAGPVSAVDGPLRLATEVTDQADVLSASEEERVAAALSQLRDDTGIQLFVAYVDTTGADDVNTWTADTADASSLGGNDALIVVAIDDRTYSMWVGSALVEISDAEIDSILVDALEPVLVEGDYSGAMIAAAEAMGEAAGAGGVVQTPAPATPGTATPAPAAPPGGAESGGGFNITPILAFLLVAGGLFLVARWMVTKRARDKAGAAIRDQLNSEANRALLATDEALKDAANDVDFAAAQWGDQEVLPYRDAIRQANDELRASFALRQRLDDAYPEKPPEREQMLREIIARCSGAQQLLDAQEQRFDDLQELQRVAPDQLAALPAAISAVRLRMAGTEQTAVRLHTTYAPSATASVEGNVAEAGKALDAASAEAERGSAVVATKPSDGVVALRRSQEALARATQLVEGIERLATGLDDAAARLPAELEAAAADVAAARDAIARLGQVPGGPASAAAADPAAALRAAEAALVEARTSAEATPLDPLVAIGRAAAANQAADAILAQVASAQAQVARRRQVAEAAIATAQGHVTRATDFITTRRHGVGETARTRAAEASMRLDQARGLAATDPEAAAATANRATALADEAYRLAAGEFDGWNRGGGPVAGPYAGGGGGGGDIAGAVIGGVIGAILAGAARGGGGGGSGAGWGGSPWGGTGGMKTGGFGLPRGPIGGGSAGRTRGGGFSLPSGGGGSRGGGGGGGGGRVRGGRW